MLLAATVPKRFQSYLATEALADQATTVTVTVDRGQTLGSASVRCLKLSADGSWSSELPKCQQHLISSRLARGSSSSDRRRYWELTVEELVA